MSRMTRTQLTLEEDEYLFLKAQALRTGTSLSSIVRSLVRARMNAESEIVPRIWDLAGLISESDFTGKDHDEVIRARLESEMGKPEVASE